MTSVVHSSIELGEGKRGGRLEVKNRARDKPSRQHEDRRESSHAPKRSRGTVMFFFLFKNIPENSK